MHLRRVLARHSLGEGRYPPTLKVRRAIQPTLSKWGGEYLRGIRPSGSLAKKTAVLGGTDVDLFLSVGSNVPDDLRTIYNTLFNALWNDGFLAYRKNVAIGLEIEGYKVDLTPGRRQHGFGGNHSLYSNIQDTWLQTNIAKQIAAVTESGRVSEIKLIKIWRNYWGFDWPSFYLEMFVIDVLRSRPRQPISKNIAAIFDGMARSLSRRRIIDPANSNNVLSDTLSFTQKLQLEQAATKALSNTWEIEFP